MILSSTPTPARVHTSLIAADEPGPAVWLMGAHNRAGVATLTQYLSFAGDCDRMWPSAADIVTESPYVVIVARETSDDLKAAHALIVEHREQNLDCELLGLMTVASSPSAVDKSIRQYRDIVATAAGAHWRIGWHRFLAAATRSALPRWHPITDGVPEQTKGTKQPAVPKDVIEAGIGIVTAIQRAVPHLRTRH